MASRELTEELQETLGVFATTGGLGEPLTTSEVAACNDVSRRSTYERLERLVDRGLLETKKAGASGRIWWRPVRDVGQGVSERDAGHDVDGEQTAARQHGRLVQELDDIFERIDDAFFALDEDWQFTYVNDHAAELVQLPVTELLGAKIWDALPETAEGPPREMAERAMETQESTEFEFFAEMLGIWIESRVYPSESGMSVYFRDVTDRKERERERELYETVFSAVDDGVYVLDGEFHFTQVNDAYVEMTGYDRDDLLGEHCSLVVGDDVTAESADRLEEMIARGDSGTSLEADIIRADGSRLRAESRFTTFPSGNSERPGKVGVVRDISERKERERELEQYETIIETVKDGIYVLDEESRFVAVNDAFCDIVGHDRDDLLGEHATLVTAEGRVQHGEELVEVLTADDHEVATVEEEVVTSDSDPVVVENRVSTYQVDAETPGRIGTVRDITERKERERELIRQREQLAALNSLNVVARNITDAVIEQSTREQIEQTVCERLADTDSYKFAWVGDVAANSDSVSVRAEAGVDGYLDGITVSVDPDDERSQGPTSKALRTGEIHVSADMHNDASHAPWRDHVEEHGVRSSAAIPLTHEDTVYGVLNVYAERSHAFEGQERTVIAQLGEVVGHAIGAVERKRALMSDEVVELEFRLPDIFETLDIPAVTRGRIALDQTLPVDDGEFIVYGTATGDAVDALDSIAETLPHWKEVTVHSGGDPTTFELHLTDPPVLSTVASLGGYVEAAAITDGDYRMTVHVAPTVEVRQITDAVQEAYPKAELLRRQQVGRSNDNPRRLLVEELTDRQRTALEVAYHAGFFEWPRDASGEDVAESLDVSPPTFHQHLRKAQKKVVDSLTTSEGLLGDEIPE